MEGPLSRDEIMLIERELDERQRNMALSEAGRMCQLLADIAPEAVVARAETYLAFLKGGASGKASD